MEEKQSRFEDLFLPHLDAAYNLARWLVRGDQEAQNVVQEAYIRALKAFGKFRRADARSWLLTIVRNTAYSWMKKHPNDSNMILFEEAIGATPTGEPSSESSPEERIQKFHHAFNKLPVEFREVLVLREIEGWSYEQLASALSVPVATVMSRLSQARRRLHQEVPGN